jgi:hypothetical protein
MQPQYKPGGDAYDIRPDPNITYDSWRCPSCRWSGQSRRHIKEERPTDLRCPSCGTPLVNYYDFQHKQWRRGSWKLFSIDVAVGALLGVVGWVLYPYFEEGLLGVFVTFLLSTITLRVAWSAKNKRIYEDNGLFYEGGYIWPAKAGFIFILALGIVFFVFFIKGVISYF